MSLNKERDAAISAKTTDRFSGIDKALKEGLVMRAFGIGGGNRAVRIENPSKTNRPEELGGYGEAPDLTSALVEADKDYLRGGPRREGFEEYWPVESLGLPLDILDKWIEDGSRTLYARASSGRISIRAGTFAYRDILSVEAQTFEQAYDALSQQLGSGHFDMARGSVSRNH